MSGQNPLTSYPYLLVILLGSAAAACSGEDNLTIPPTTASLEITTSTTGAEPDPDGYTVQMDAGAAQAIEVAGTIRHSDIAPGAHTVQLAGVSANCTVAGENPRAVSVAAGETATVAFAVSCGATTGGLQVTSSSNGPASDPDGYTLTVDGTDRGALGVSGSLTLDALPPGEHLIGLSGLAANCRVEGDNPRPVTITTGQSEAISFAVTCAAPPANAGSLRIVTSSTGPDQDIDGYAFAVDGGTSQPIGASATANLANVAAGTHQVRLSGLADNCTVQGGNPRSVTVTAGAAAEVSFAVACSAAAGTIRVSVTTSGSSPDPDGYVAKLDGGEPGQPIPPSGSATFTSVRPGRHSVALTGVAANCSVTEGASRTITLAPRATAEVSFVVTCSTPGLQWQAMESGTDGLLTDVWGSSATDVHVTGVEGSSSSQGRVFHYDGRQWSREDPDHPSPLFGIWGSARNDFFAVGYTGAPFGLVPYIAHFDGTSWASMVAPAKDPSWSDLSLVSVWGTSSNNVYAVGTYYTSYDHAFFAHYDGTSWSELPLPLPYRDYTFNVKAVSGTSANDVYAVGYNNGPDFPYQGLVLHYDGSNWTVFAYPEPAVRLHGVWNSSPSDVFVVGDIDDNRGLILHYDGNRWSSMPIPAGGPLSDVWGSSPTDVYAVGDGILHYDGQSWTKVSDRGGRAVWGSSSTDVFVVGSGGTILHGTR
jgi:hypothetical protein